MAKNKRKVSASQRDKFAIETAKILKRKGVLSKQTKLHGGKYISRAVLKKVQELQHVARPDYRALKVTKDIARAAKAEGYQTVSGNRVIVPADHDFIKRVKAGMVAGIKPVKGGFMSEVTIPFTEDNVEGLINRLQYDSLDDLKLDHEQFAFSFHGNMSYRAFRNTDDMRRYLEHYKQQEEMKAVKLFRLHPSDVRQFILGPDRRKRAKTVQDRRSATRKTYAERMRKLEAVAPERAKAMREKRNQYNKERREKLLADPIAMQKYREAGKKRAKISYDRKRGK